MKIVNGSNRVIMAPFGGTLITIMPKNVSGDLVANKELVRAIITSGKISEVGLVTYSSAELQLINEVSGAAPFIHDDIDEAINKLIPGGIKPIVEQKVISGGETVLVQTEEVGSESAVTPTEPVTEVKELVEQNETLKIEKKKLSEQIAALVSDKKNLADKVAELNAQIVKVSDNEELEKKVNDLTATKKSLEGLLEQAQESNAKLTEELEKQKTETAKLLKSAGDKSNTQEEELTKLRSQIAEQAAALKKKDEELATKGSSADADKTIEELTSKLNEANAGLERFRKILNNTVKTNNLTWDAKGEQYVPSPVE